MIEVTLEFLPLTAALVEEISPWFDDAATQRFLGDRSWIQRELTLVSTQPGTTFRGLRVTGRYAWVSLDSAFGLVGFLDVEVYDDHTAAFAVVVAPEFRGRGICAQLLTALDERVELSAIVRYTGSFDASNNSSRRALLKAGFRIAAEVNEEGDYAAERNREGDLTG